MGDVPGPDEAPVPDPDAGPAPEDALGAPADALLRARAAARARGLRPGVKPKRRFKDMPGVGGEGRRGGRDPQLLGDELDEVVERLQSHGTDAEIGGFGGVRVAICLDPAGNRWELRDR